MSVELNAYLFFPGNAKQATAFYQRVFGGQVTITRRGDVDPTATTPEQRNQVINALLNGGDITLRASDREDTSLDPQTRTELSLIGADDARLRSCSLCSRQSARPMGPLHVPDLTVGAAHRMNWLMPAVQRCRRLAQDRPCDRF
jgi:hypothetical protein